MSVNISLTQNDFTHWWLMFAKERSSSSSTPLRVAFQDIASVECSDINCQYNDNDNNNDDDDNDDNNNENYNNNNDNNGNDNDDYTSNDNDNDNNSYSNGNGNSNSNSNNNNNSDSVSDSDSDSDNDSDHDSEDDENENDNNKIITITIFQCFMQSLIIVNMISTFYVRLRLSTMTELSSSNQKDSTNAINLSLTRGTHKWGEHYSIFIWRKLQILAIYFLVQNRSEVTRSIMHVDNICYDAVILTQGERININFRYRLWCENASNYKSGRHFTFWIKIVQ